MSCDTCYFYCRPLRADWKRYEDSFYCLKHETLRISHANCREHQEAGKNELQQLIRAVDIMLEDEHCPRCAEVDRDGEYGSVKCKVSRSSWVRSIRDRQNANCTNRFNLAQETEAISDNSGA